MDVDSLAQTGKDGKKGKGKGKGQVRRRLKRRLARECWSGGKGKDGGKNKNGNGKDKKGKGKGTRCLEEWGARKVTNAKARSRRKRRRWTCVRPTWCSWMRWPRSAK